MPPSISVLLPVRNSEAFLPDCLESLDAQSLSDFEVVAVNDGSTDGTLEILRSWARSAPGRRVISTSHRGLIAALNRGLRHCSADFVARMDADDRADPRRFELQLERFSREPELDVVSCLVRHFPEDQVAEGFRIYETWLNGLTTHEEILRERFIESPIPHPSVMLRRETLLDAGGYLDRGWPEDYDLWLRLVERGARFAKVPETLLFWRDHPDRLTRTDRRYAVERFLECKAHHLVEGPLRETDRVFVWGAGQTGRRLSKHLVRRGAPLVGFIDIDPAKIGGTRRGLPIHSADELDRILLSGGRFIVLAAVSSRGARALIRQRLVGIGLTEGREFWCVA